jgi:stearoyl-CoA desaturase (delta-9 desaturase)
LRTVRGRAAAGLLAIPSFGESWHNGHHAFPASAVHGLEPGQFDISALVIRGMEKLRLATEVKRPDSQQIERRRVPDRHRPRPHT